MKNSESPLDHCFVCNVAFETSFGEGPPDWPGVIFEATGNWGSTIFDPTPSERPASLTIRICDKCVLDRRNKIHQIGDQLSDSLRSDVIKFFEKSNEVT